MRIVSALKNNKRPSRTQHNIQQQQPKAGPKVNSCMTKTTVLSQLLPAPMPFRFPQIYTTVAENSGCSGLIQRFNSSWTQHGRFPVSHKHEVRCWVALRREKALRCRSVSVW